MKLNKLSIILCTLNEEEFIAQTIDELNKTFENIEIIIVDDNSTDKTIEKISNLNLSNTKVFQRKKSKGLSSAFMLGLIHSTGDVIGWVDTNMPYVIKHYRKIFNDIEEIDLGLLSRYSQEDAGDQRKFLRKVSSKILNNFAKFILRSKITDLSSGLFLMKRELLLEAIPDANGYGDFMIEFITDLEKKGFKIKEYPYVQLPENQGTSKSISSYYTFFKFGFFYFLRIFKCFFKNI